MKKTLQIALSAIMSVIFLIASAPVGEARPTTNIRDSYSASGLGITNIKMECLTGSLPQVLVSFDAVHPDGEHALVLINDTTGNSVSVVADRYDTPIHIAAFFSGTPQKAVLWVLGQEDGDHLSKEITTIACPAKQKHVLKHMNRWQRWHHCD